MSLARAHSGLYGGRTIEQRRAERRAKLLDAGSAIWVSEGWAAVSMRAVCAQAGVTDRYFYEEFRNVDDLLGTLWDQARDGTFAVLLDHAATPAVGSPRERLRSLIAVFITHLAAHPEDASMLHGDGSGSAVLEARQRELRSTGIALIADLAEPLLDSAVDRAKFLVLVRMAMAGFFELVAGWQSGDIAGDVDDIVRHATGFGDLLVVSIVS